MTSRTSSGSSSTSGMPGGHREPEAADHEQDRVRDPRPLGHDQQQRDHREDREQGELGRHRE